MNKKELLDKFDSNKNYILIGFPRSGTHSLCDFLNDNGIKILKNDFVLLTLIHSRWHYDYTYGVNRSINHKKKFPLMLPVIITRDPIERTHTAMEFFRFNHADEPNYKEQLEQSVKHSDYKKLIKPFEDLNPIMLKFEEIITIPEMYAENAIPNKRKLTNTKKIEIETEFIKQKVLI